MDEVVVVQEKSPPEAILYMLRGFCSFYVKFIEGNS